MRETPDWPENAPGVVLRFTHVKEREQYDVKDIVNGVKSSSIRAASLSPPDPATCKFGDYFYDRDNKHMFVCYSGKGKVYNQV